MTMFHFRLFREKTKGFFFKKPHYFCPFLGKTECSSKFCSYQYFLKNVRLSIIVPNFEEVMSAFRVTKVSQARMHTCMEQVYHQTLHASYGSDSEINSLSVN